MCLTLTKKFEIQTAEEDIVVYKKLKELTVPIVKDVKHGDKFTGVIKGIQCEGEIVISKSNRIYFCTNEKFLAGNSCDDKAGYEYSWVLDDDVKEIYVNGEKKEFGEKTFLGTYYRREEVEIGKTYVSKLVKIDNTVEEGLHSYGNKPHYIINKILAECIIPKGAKYYEGKFENELSYASDTLKYIRLITKAETHVK